MRVTGGSAKGQQLRLPKKFNIRPTTDRTREAIFSILASIGCSWELGLDLFAGTGALGIEALSRNAEWIDFVDQEPQCCAIIKQNLEKLGLAQNAHVHCCTVFKALTFLENEYDIIFMDPPYSDTSIEEVVTQLDNSKFIGNHSLVVVSHASRFTLSEKYGSLHLVKNKRYGDTGLSIYQREACN
jgi:16S rRNA (guanine966-N2)-methyltransferase